MMRVPFLDLKAQYASIKEEVLPAINWVLDNTAYVLGKPVSEFETAFAKEHGVQFCYGVSSGTDGNHMVLWALGVGPGDEVIIPANTFIATAWGATLCGAKPVFVDCDADSYTLDPRLVEAKITPRTRAIVAVHLYGQPADMDPLNAVAAKHNIVVVEDCAQSHFAEYKGKRNGGLGRASSYSFYPGKNLGAYGEGGAVATNDPELARRFKMLRDHGAEKKYYHEMYGHNYRMEGIQGAVLGVKLRHLSAWTESRRCNAALYNKHLQGIPGVSTPKEMPYAKHVYHLYVIRASRRDELQKYLEEKGVSTGLHYPVPLHVQKAFAHLGYKEGDFPVTEKAANEILSLPMYAELTEEQIGYVADMIRSFYA
jgi:dTDP-4-amino-4,6-dideoxygalactose transaminase